MGWCLRFFVLTFVAVFSQQAHAAIQFRAFGGIGSTSANNVGIFSGSRTSDTDSSTTGKTSTNFGAAILFMSSVVGTRLSYTHATMGRGSGTVVFNGGGGGASSVDFSNGELGADIFLRFAGEETNSMVFFVGGGAIYSMANLKISYALSNTPGTVRGDTLDASGTAIGEKAFVGLDLPLGETLGLAFELGYRLVDIKQYKANSGFNYSSGGTNPNSGFHSGDTIRKSVSNPTGFTGDVIHTDLSGPYMNLGLLLYF